MKKTEDDLFINGEALQCLFHNEEFDDSIFLDGVDVLHIGFRKMLIEIKTQDLLLFLELLRHIASAEEIWSDPEKGSVMVKTPLKGLNILLVQTEAERLKHMLEVAFNELSEFRSSLLPPSITNE